MEKPILPVVTGTAPSTCCQTFPGDEHQLSCDEVSFELWTAYSAWQTERIRELHSEEN